MGHSPVLFCRYGVLVGVQHLGNPKVGEFAGEVVVGVVRQEDVVGGEVRVDDALAVHVGHDVGHLIRHLEHSSNIQRPVTFLFPEEPVHHTRGQRAQFAELEQEPNLVLPARGVIHHIVAVRGDQIGVRQLFSQLRLLFGVVTLLRHDILRRHHLHRHLLPLPRTSVNRAVGAFPDGRANSDGQLLRRQIGRHGGEVQGLRVARPRRAALDSLHLDKHHHRQLRGLLHRTVHFGNGHWGADDVTVGEELLRGRGVEDETVANGPVPAVTLHIQPKILHPLRHRLVNLILRRLLLPLS
mmetsp:Transcript_39791/g.71424  ORF Transcript_39791/g.71424 Transcript_39791/m.71424 type:complete len:297 (-) Transcript_39791:1069-1959(-)